MGASRASAGPIAPRMSCGCAAKKIKGSLKEVVGKAAGDAKLEAEGKADKVEGKVQNAVGSLKNTLKSTASTRLRATSQRKTLLASAAMIGGDLFCGPAGAQGVSQSASPTSQTRLATPSRSHRRSDGSHVTETALIPDVVPHPSAGRGSVMKTGATMFQCFCYIRSAQAIQSRD
jgi:uncharacterized protein YjbJ (UPF0337 family)